MDVSSSKLAPQFNHKIVQEVLGPIRGDATDTKLLTEIISLGEGIIESGLPESVQTYLFSHEFNDRIGRLRKLQEGLQIAAENVKETWNRFQEKGAANEIRFFGAKVNDHEVGPLLDRLRAAVSNHKDLGTWIEYCRAWKDCASVDLLQLIDAFDFRLTPTTLCKALDRLYCRSLARSIFEHHPDLTRMHGVSLRQARERFQELDRKILSCTSKASQQSCRVRISTPDSRHHCAKIIPVLY